MNIGDIVMIYEDPYTRLKPEGKARLVKVISEDEGSPRSERWIVKFEGDCGEYERVIVTSQGAAG